MKLALIVPRVTGEPVKNLESVLTWVGRAADEGAGFVLFPEAVLTGLSNNDDPEHDLPLGGEVPGPVTQAIAEACRERGVWVGFGMLEREGEALHDSAFLIDPSGLLRLRYRRMDSHWHGPRVDPETYREGTAQGWASTPFGKVGFLICGDLFNDEVVARFREMQVDWLLFPFARCYGDGVIDPEWWRQEQQEYVERVRKVGVHALMVNYLADASLKDDGSFGGALVMSREGEILAELPIGQEGMLCWNV